MGEWGFMTMEMARTQVRGLEEAMRVAPRPDLCAQLGGCYLMLGKPEAAAKLYELAFESLKIPEVAMSYATVLRDLGRHAEAGRIGEYAYWLAPEVSYARLLHSESLLRAGLWREAWMIYDISRATKMGERLRLNLPGKCRQWDGQVLPEDEFLFVLMEGGAGDRINYARWLTKLEERVNLWKVFCYEPQAGLFTRWLGRERVVLDGDKLPEMDVEARCWWTTVFALPANFEAGPGDVPQWGGDDFRFEISDLKKEFPDSYTRLAWQGHSWLRASDEAVEKYKFNRPADGLPMIGLCWEAAEASPINDPNAPKTRSLSDAQAMRIVVQTADKVHWIGVQGNGAGYSIAKPLGWPMQTVEFETWEDTAGLLANLDAVLTVDTGTLHLAGAMGRPMGILLGANSDWKFLEKGKCPFYRTAKLYRNGPRLAGIGDGGRFENAVTAAINAIRQDGLGAFG